MEGKLSELRESPKQDKARPHIPLGLAWERGLTEGLGEAEKTRGREAVLPTSL